METKFENITLDSYIIMPNHIHGIIIINSNEEISLFKIMQWFKTMTTNGYIKGVNAGLYKPFKNKLWQRGYHDHIIRTKKDFHRIQKYITENPKSWNNDRHNQQRL
jgi:REP element-mobilizing transposase RayT